MFFGLCFLRGVLKVWDGLPKISERHIRDDLSFQKRLDFNASKSGMDTADEMLHGCSNLGQHPEDGHLLYCSTSWALWHWKHTQSSNKYKGFYYQTGRKAVLTRDNCKACRDPMYCI